MLLYGKYMLNFDKVFDFEAKLDKINAMTHDQSFEALQRLFDETNKAVAIVGNTDKPLAL
jgi:hypothetical protein